MAGKKDKKKQLKRKQQKQQRRQARVRRKAQSSKSPPTSASRLDAELRDDMQTFWQPQASSAALPEMKMMEQVLMPIMDSQDLADEPEFENIVIDPLLCVNTYADVGKEIGMTPERMSALPEEERRDIQLQMLEGSARRLLTDELRQDILAGLNALRKRLKRAEQPDKTARIAAMQSFLTKEVGDELWPMLGLVHAIIQRSLAVGFELAEASVQVLGTSEADEDDSTLLERLKKGGLTQKTEALLGKHSGIANYLRQQVDRLWDEGIDAIYEGDLYLELFTEDELRAAAELMAETLGYDREAETRPEITKDTGLILIKRMDEYITDLFTPERLDQLRDRLTSVMNEEALEGKWLGFVLMLVEDMKADDAVTTGKAFLMRALFGELRKLDDTSDEDDD